MINLLIFLDFDGVLHEKDAAHFENKGTSITVTGEGLFRFAPMLADVLADYADVAVIITSSWRHRFPREELVERMGTLGTRVIGTINEVRRNTSATNLFEECETMAGDRQATDWLIIDDQFEIVFAYRTPTTEQQSRLLVCDSNLALDTPGVLETLKKWLRDADRPKRQHCAKLQPGIEPFPKRPASEGVPDEVYEDNRLLEHPAVPGLVLTRDERVYGALLEIIDSDGMVRSETLLEKRFRILWKHPIPATKTTTMKDFVKMDLSLFPGKPG